LQGNETLLICARQPGEHASQTALLNVHLLWMKSLGLSPIASIRPADFMVVLGRDDVAPHNAMRVLKIVWQFT
jgi:hypothetical protein